MLTSKALLFYSIGMIGYGLMEILNKAFYAMQDSKTPMKTSVVAIILNIVLSLTLVKYMGYTGLPLAASITSIVIAILMIAMISKNVKGIVNREDIKEFIKILVSSAFMGFIIISNTNQCTGTGSDKSAFFTADQGADTGAGSCADSCSPSGFRYLTFARIRIGGAS